MGCRRMDLKAPTRTFSKCAVTPVRPWRSCSRAMQIFGDENEGGMVCYMQEPNLELSLTVTWYQETVHDALQHFFSDRNPDRGGAEVAA